jgi:hypothetical protein
VAAGAPQIIRDRLPIEGREHPQASVFNLYRPPTIEHGDPREPAVGSSMRRIWPDDTEHMLDWFAQRVQYPGQDQPRALLGGDPGIGKDTILGRSFRPSARGTVRPSRPRCSSAASTAS